MSALWTQKKPLIEPPVLFVKAAQSMYFASSVTPIEDLLTPLSKYFHTNLYVYLSLTLRKRRVNFLSYITALIL